MSSKTTRRRAFGDVRNQRILSQSSANKKTQKISLTDIKQPQQSQQTQLLSAKTIPSNRSPLLKQSSTPTEKPNEKSPSVKDENDLSDFTKASYDPRLETYPMDDALYHKIAQLELADDGIPTFNNLDAEPFDF